MAKQSIGELHAKITANGQQAISELNRVDNQFRRAAGRVENEVDKMSKAFKKKFTVGDMGKSLLGGLGLGSGFAVASTVMEQITDHFREQAEFAKSIEESTGKQLDFTKQIIALRQTDKIEAAEKAYREKFAELENARRPRTEVIKMAGGRGTRAGTALVQVPITAEQNKHIHALDAEVKQLAVTLEQLKQPRLMASVNNSLTGFFGDIDKEALRLAEINEMNEKAGAGDQDRRIRALSTGLAEQEKAYDELIDAQRKKNDETAKERKEIEALAQKYREIADPLLKYKIQVEEVNRVNSAGVLSANAVGKALDQIHDDASRAEIDQLFAGLNTKATETTTIARDMGFAFSSAFEDAIIGGEKLGDVMRGLAQDILRMGFRLGVTNPLMNSVFGSANGWEDLPTLFGAPAADGGFRSGSKPYLVGENGPEIFNPGRAGTIIPNHAIGGGGTFYIDARGADRTGLARLESMIAALHGSIETRAVSAVMDKVARGGAGRRAFA